MRIAVIVGEVVDGQVWRVDLISVLTIRVPNHLQIVYVVKLRPIEVIEPKLQRSSAEWLIWEARDPQARHIKLVGISLQVAWVEEIGLVVGLEQELTALINALTFLFSFFISPVNIEL